MTCIQMSENEYIGSKQVWVVYDQHPIGVFEGQLEATRYAKESVRDSIKTIDGEVKATRNVRVKMLNMNLYK